jgi:glycine cleavage system H protein
MYPNDRKYTKDHEWIRVDGNEATVGITHFAQSQLGDVVFVELPDVGRHVKQGESFGQIESVKAVSELYAPVSGEVTAVNANLGPHPDQVNSAPHDAWMIRVRPSQPDEIAALLDSAGYSDLVK